MASIEQVEVMKNPAWMQIIFYLAIAGFPALGIYLFWLGLGVYEEQGLAPSLLIFGLGIAGLHIASYGFLLFKYVGAVVHFDDKGFTINLGSQADSFLWTSPISVREYNYAELLRIYDAFGETLLVVDYWTPNYEIFYEKLAEKTAI